MSRIVSRISALVVDDEAPARTLLRYLLEKEPDIEIAGEASSGAQAISLVNSLSPDLLLLDIQMPRLDGFEVIARLGSACPHVIFVTAFHEFALKAFEVHAVDYVLKPPVPARFAAAIERARRTIRTERKGVQRPRLSQLLRHLEVNDNRREQSPGHGAAYVDRLAVRDRQGIRVVALEKVQWFESADHLSYLHLLNSRHMTDHSLAELERILDPERFMRIRRNIIINLSRVASVRAGRFGSLLVRLLDGSEFPTSRFLSDHKCRQLILRCEIDQR